MLHVQDDLWSSSDVHVTNEAKLTPPASWSASLNDGWGIGIARRGAYRRRRAGVEQVVDTNTGFIRKDRDEVGLCRINDGPNTLTFISATPCAMGAVAEVDLRSADFTMTPSLDLLHRRLLAAVEANDDPVAVESVALALVADALAQKDERVLSYARRSTERSRRRLVADACAELHGADKQLGLVALARRIGASPFHLSRVFREITGMTIPQYRSRLRVHAALTQVAAGATDLASVAAWAGFADHSHMTRSISKYYGSPPSRLRELLATNELELLRLRR